MTASAMLADVEAAITAILQGAQSHSITTGGTSRTYQYADIGELYKRRDKLKAEVNREARGGSGGIRVRGATPL